MQAKQQVQYVVFIFMFLNNWNGNKDDVAQAIRYKEWLENHHLVTRERNLIVNSYLVCRHKHAVAGTLRGIEVLTKDNFCSAIVKELLGETNCSFIDEWISSKKTEMPDMLQAMEIMYREGRISYIADVNKSASIPFLNILKKQRESIRRYLYLSTACLVQERLLLAKV